MFKFKIIDRTNPSANTPLPSGMFNENVTALIIMDTREQGVIGEMSIIKRDLSHLQEDIRRLIPTRALYQNYVWECSSICFMYPKSLNFDSSWSKHFSRHFYRSLYEGLVAFGQRTGSGFVIVKLTAETYPHTKDLGMWPYIIQFLPKEFSDDFFYGVLPLRGRCYENYQKDWEKKEKEQGYVL